MNHVFQIPDDLYTKFATYAAQHNQTPESLFLAWVNEVIHRQEESLSLNNLKLENVDQINSEQQNKRGEESLKSPLLEVAGMFAINEPSWADKHDEYLAEAYMDSHATEK